MNKKNIDRNFRKERYDFNSLLKNFSSYIDENKLSKVICLLAPAIADINKISYFDLYRFDKMKKSNAMFENWKFGDNLIYTHPHTREKFGVMAKPGRVFQKIAKDNIDPQITIDFVARYRSIFNNSENISFKKLKKVSLGYRTDTYIDDYCGTLKTSCMNNKLDYLELYDINDNVELLILTDSTGKTKARALYWYGVYVEKLQKKMDFIDRVYTCDENDVELFKTYARKHNCLMKRDQRAGGYDFIYFYNNNTFNIDTVLEITLNTDCGYFPYLDTFQYSDDGDLFSTEEGKYEYIKTDGTRDGDGCMCRDCENFYNHDHISYRESLDAYVCDYCIDEHYIQCYDCSEYVYFDNSYSDVNTEAYYCESCYSEHLKLCDDCDEYHFCDDIIYIETLEKDLCEDCIDNMKSNGELIECEECYELTTDFTLTAKGTEYCNNCIDNMKDNGELIECEECDELTTNFIVTENGSKYCEDCIEDKAFKCTDCNRYFDFDETDEKYPDDSSDALCPSCYEKLEKCTGCEALLNHY